VSVEDVSSRAGLLLRVAHTLAAGRTWYGRVGYGFGRGGFNISPAAWARAAAAAAAAPLGDLAADLSGIDDAAAAIVERYRGAGERAAAPGRARARLRARSRRRCGRPAPHKSIALAGRTAPAPLLPPPQPAARAPKAP
jgi:hypothetical protein